MGGFALTIASKINMALSRMNCGAYDEDEDVQDLIAILEELNLHTDLTVKLNNQSKLCKILQQSPDIKVEQLDQSQRAIKGLLEDSKRQLEQLQQDKETAIEEFLEILAEEKFTHNQDIKSKYNKMTTMVKNAANKEEKMAQLEEKRAKEIEEMTEDFNRRKREGLAEIKDKFNGLAQKVKIDANQIKEVLKCGKKVPKQAVDLDNVEVLIPLS